MWDTFSAPGSKWGGLRCEACRAGEIWKRVVVCLHGKCAGQHPTWYESKGVGFYQPGRSVSPGGNILHALVAEPSVGVWSCCCDMMLLLYVVCLTRHFVCRVAVQTCLQRAMYVSHHTHDLAWILVISCCGTLPIGTNAYTHYVDHSHAVINAAPHSRCLPLSLVHQMEARMVFVLPYDLSLEAAAC